MFGSSFNKAPKINKDQNKTAEDTNPWGFLENHLSSEQKKEEITYNNQNSELLLKKNGGKYAYVGYFKYPDNGEGLAGATTNHRDYIFINEKGEQAFPGTFRSVYDFFNGVALVELHDGTSLTIDPKGNILERREPSS